MWPCPNPAPARRRGPADRPARGRRLGARHLGRSVHRTGAHGDSDAGRHRRRDGRTADRDAAERADAAGVPARRAGPVDRAEHRQRGRRQVAGDAGAGARRARGQPGAQRRRGGAAAGTRHRLRI
ncbi:hypothetical protein G6F59_016906 [Rhizopus arrhizus]|nr:hypothetical protein G6F59_016906 [Rhizopus arrhizus]